MFQLTCPGRQCVKNDVLSGLTVALALVPEAVAFAFVAGVEPLVGLYGAFMMGLITALIGGRPGMISGATGAMAVVMVSLVATHGVQYLFAAVILTGLFQVSAGILRLGKFIRLVPYPVMLGFVNGLAIVIFLAQLKQFQVPGADGGSEWLSGGATVDHARPDRTDHGDHSFSAQADGRRAGLAGRDRHRDAARHRSRSRRTHRAGRAARHERRPGRDHRRRPAGLQHPERADKLGDAGDHPALQPDPGRRRPDRITADAEPDRRTHRDARPRQQGVYRPGCRQLGQRPVRRHGWLRDDRPVADQHQFRRPWAPVRHRRGARAAGLHPVRVRPDRDHPGRSAGRRDVRGGHRHVRVGLVPHVRQGTRWPTR